MNTTIESALTHAKLVGWANAEIDGRRYLVACGSYMDSILAGTSDSEERAMLMVQLNRQAEHIKLLREQNAELESKNHALKKALVKLGEGQ